MENLQIKEGIAFHTGNPTDYDFNIYETFKIQEIQSGTYADKFRDTTSLLALSCSSDDIYVASDGKYPYWIVKTIDSSLKICRLESYNKNSGIVKFITLSENNEEIKINMDDEFEIFYIIFALQNMTDLSKEPYNIKLLKSTNL